MYDLSQLSNDYIIPSCQNDLKLNCAQFHRAELGDFPARHVWLPKLHRLLEDPRLVVLPFGLFIYIYMLLYYSIK